MTISSVGNTQATYTVQSSNTSEISKLQKQISELQKTISETQNDDSLDADTKSQQVSVYQAQLTQLQTQLTQLQNKGTQNTQAVQSTKGVQDTQNAQNGLNKNFDFSSKFDTVEISDAARAWNKQPPALDFDSMSDDEFSEWLTNMQNETGSIPGVSSDSGISSVSQLNSEQLDELRRQLSEEQDDRLAQMQANHMPPPPPQGDDEDEISTNATLQQLWSQIQ